MILSFKCNRLLCGWSEFIFESEITEDNDDEEDAEEADTESLIGGSIRQLIRDCEIVGIAEI